MRNRLERLLSAIIADDSLHVRWVNTLSYLENCGARKIAACEHPTRVHEEMLKHAAEEFRHAHYLKSQLARITTLPPDDYRQSYLLGGYASRHLLQHLDARISRYLLSCNVSRSVVRIYAYILVTYAVERQAEQLYQIYDTVLRRSKSKITVRSILLEEEGHLEQMENELRMLRNGSEFAEHALKLSAQLCDAWLGQIEQDVNLRTLCWTPDEHADKSDNTHDSHDTCRRKLFCCNEPVVKK